MPVVPICRVLTEHGCKIDPSTFYAEVKRAPCARAIRDVEVLVQIRRVHEGSRGGLYGVSKVYHQLRRENVLVQGTPVARCTVECLMRWHGLKGVHQPSAPGSPTRPARGRTESSNTSAGQLSDSVTPPTNAAGYAGPAHAPNGVRHPEPGHHAPTNSEEPSIRPLNVGVCIAV
ncbi:hypothetical protein EH165_08035 [Nakamurella antarctica]|uniref:HTH-like domain-containing protein n=1 Tax=Nakamurella antarctica TaxID=1902245 RepID=A0A3G8ZVQ7_9ACTN|nr:hypothetical protein EH165_08035 [Nakamurella antarctica]